MNQVISQLPEWIIISTSKGNSTSKTPEEIMEIHEADDKAVADGPSRNLADFRCFG
jgi:hypothetical protein